jgi:hypothetical protein
MRTVFDFLFDAILIFLVSPSVFSSATGGGIGFRVNGGFGIWPSYTGKARAGTMIQNDLGSS